MTEKIDIHRNSLDNNISENKIHILLIEDNPNDVRLIQEMLRDASFDNIELEIRNNLTDGIHSISEKKVNVIILDLSLPDSFRLESLSKMLEHTNEIPIIVLTGTNDQLLAIEAVKSGAEDYLVKGIVSSLSLGRSIYYAIERHKITNKLKLSEEKARDGFNRAEFYKDIFAHDMNNILQSILSATQLCEYYLKHENGTSNINEFMEIVKGHIKRGARLTYNVRKISQLEQTKIELTQLDVLNILERTILNVKKEFINRNINIQIEKITETTKILVNSYIQNVFENLLINSVNHNQNPTVEINIKISKEQEDNQQYFKMEFIDNGSGIEDRRKRNIFQRGFKQDKSIYGMGLGLSLVSIIINKFNGKIWVEDRIKGDYKRGSNFIIKIPMV